MSRPCRAHDIRPRACIPWANAQGFYLGHPFGAPNPSRVVPINSHDASPANVTTGTPTCQGGAAETPSKLQAQSLGTKKPPSTKEPCKGRPNQQPRASAPPHPRGAPKGRSNQQPWA